MNTDTSLKVNPEILAQDHDVHLTRKYNISNMTWRHQKSHCPTRQNLSFPLLHTFALSLSFSIFSEIYFLRQNGVLGKRRQETFRHTTLLFHQQTAAGDSRTWACAREQRDVPSSHHQQALSHFILTKLHIPRDTTTAPLISRMIETRHTNTLPACKLTQLYCKVNTHTNKGYTVLFCIQLGYL